MTGVLASPMTSRNTAAFPIKKKIPNWKNFFFLNIVFVFSIEKKSVILLTELLMALLVVFKVKLCMKTDFEFKVKITSKISRKLKSH